ncbi:hypothetical protein [Shewanella litoralis]|uniref:DUF3389 family protein n=1 Tax=Shewanella litoralis TaxID=2282700 RepID=A0ABQ2RIG9_9GAMM|nr:hypothetical protein [Shewanella litoralis]GGQ28817.1 hypothetical protein GCM10009411_30660 [Shewanella litoralis]
MNTQTANSKLINISRINTAAGTFRVTASNNDTLKLVTVEILSSDGWEALIIETDALWYQVLLSACEQHLQEQSAQR